MAQVINTNVTSLNAQRNLNSSQNSLQVSLQRLSSGLRINSAKDDAAGLAISERMTSQIRGLNQASRNANDGISLAQTAEGALSESSTLLQRIRELAVQSANSTNSASDRASLNSEVSQLLAEMQRISETTQFNGQNIIDGTFNGAQFQVGANANQTILVNVGNAQTAALGSYQVGNTATAGSGAALSSGDLTLNSVDIGQSVSGSAKDIAAAINGVASQSGVTASASTSLASVNTLTRNQTLQAGDLVINDVDIGAVSGSNNLSTQGANIAAAINGFSNQTGVTAVSNQATGQLTLSSTTGRTINITAGSDAGYSRLENATGLEVSASTEQAQSTQTFANAVAGVSTLTFDADVGDNNDGALFTLQGVIYELDSGGAATGDILGNGNTAVAFTTGDTAATIAAAAKTAVDANVTGVTTAVVGGALEVTSDTATGSTDRTDFTSTNLLGAVIDNSATAADGVSVGDTLNVGGVTYEFGYAESNVTAGNVLVVLGADDAANAAALNTAIGVEYAAGNTNVQSTVAGAVLTLTSDLKGSAGNATVDATYAGAAVTAGDLAEDLAGGNGTAADGAGTAISQVGTIELFSSSQISIGGNNLAKAGLQTAIVSLNAASTIDISSVEGANSAIAIADGALSQITSIRGDLGAVQNRFESTISNLSATAENLNAARSRIRDTDFAQETANLTRNQILQQAGVAMLAQANSLPQLVLSLLQ